MDLDASFACATAPRRNSRHWKNGEVTWGEIIRWTEDPAAKKEAGNYLLGTLKPDTTVVHKSGEEPCTDVHRRKDFIVSRSAVTLDVDTPSDDFVDRVELLIPYAAILHTTYSSSPDEPRYRLIVPTDREMAPDEYVTAASAIMQQLGTDQFDPGTTQPERYMFKPAAQEPGWFHVWVLDGDLVDVDSILTDFVEDLSDKPLPNPSRNKRDPFELDGVIGAFNRAYADWDLLIETYDLPYEKVDEDRYHLVGSRATAGMGPIAGTAGFVFSHHTNDPAYGVTCSAFDLVRLHRFGELDEEVPTQTPVNKRPSQKAMMDLAGEDHRTLAELVGMDFAEAFDEEGNSKSWLMDLRRTSTGVVKDEIGNWDVLAQHEPLFQMLYFNEMSMSFEVDGRLPWWPASRTDNVVSAQDRLEWVDHLEREYGIKALKSRVDALIDTRAARRRRHPVREYLDGLEWDGESRIETSLPGVKPTPFTRLVARRSIVAAVARVFEPGCKWDHTLVLYGPEGLGKTTWIDRMSCGWSASLGQIGNKDTLLVMQRSWIVVSDEGHSLRKAEHDAQKEFLTRTHDVFRMPFDRETLVHPRHCVIWSTTNDEIFLRRQEGNRRFLIVHCAERMDFEGITQDYVNQVWAEAVHLYRAGEPLYFDEEESVTAAAERERFVEEDALGGLIEEFLNTKVPEDWDDRAIEARQSWRAARAEGFESAGTKTITETCSTQIWVEAMGRRLGDHRRTDLLDITNALKRIPGWEATPGRRRLPGYGPQLIFRRITE